MRSDGFRQRFWFRVCKRFNIIASMNWKINSPPFPYAGKILVIAAINFPCGHGALVSTSFNQCLQVVCHWWQLRSQCFNCGLSDHYASKCKAPLHGCTYECNAVGCGSSIHVTSRGQIPQVPSASDAPAPVRKRLASEAPAEAPVPKRLTSEASSVRERTRGPTRKSERSRR